MDKGCSEGRPGNRLRIALVMRDYSQGKGGAERYFVNLSRALEALGHEVHIFAGFFSEPETNGIRFHRVPTVAKPASLRLMSFFVNAGRMLERERAAFDVVHSLTMVSPCDVFRLGGEVQMEWLKVRYPTMFSRMIKFLVSPVHIVNHYLERRMMDPGKIPQIITISALDKKVLLSYYDYPEDRITVVYNGVDHAQFQPGVREFRHELRKKFGIGDQDLVGLFSANNFQRKGLDAVIWALSLIPEKDRPKILVIGRGRGGGYQRQAKRLGVHDRLIFLGSVGHPEQFYGASDFLVLPSRYDSFGNVHLEALACGLPVITTRMAGGSEVVRDGETGFIIENTSRVRELSLAMTLMMNSELLKKMSELAPETVREFTLERNAEETLGVYGRVLEKGKASES